MSGTATGTPISGIMRNSSPNNEAWEVRPGGMLVQRNEADDHGGTDARRPLIKISVSHGPSQHEISVPAQSTFGYMKKVIEQKTGVDARQQKILFRGKEKEDGELLNEAGVKDKSKVLVLEGPVVKEKKPEETKGSEEASKAEAKQSKEIRVKEMKGREDMSKAIQAITEVRKEVDKLADRVTALQVAMNGGTKVAEEEFVASSELLMRQLLKLDTIEAEGEARVQRKAEVRRVQNYHEVLDKLKSGNSNPFSNSSNAVSVTTDWETFDSGVESSNPPPVSPSTRITQDWESFD